MIIVGTETVSGPELKSVEQKIKDTSYQKPYPYSYKEVMVPDNIEQPVPTFSTTETNTTQTSTSTSGKIISILNSYQAQVAQNNQPCCILWHTPPATPDSYGEEGWMAYDENYHYIYVNGKWLRQPLNNFESF